MIPQEYIQEVVRRNDIEEVVGQYVQLRRRGRTLSGLCPFHNEKTPSFVVYPDTQSFYCFGCGAAGDVINFVRKYNNLGYVESVKQLAARVGIYYDESPVDSNYLNPETPSMTKISYSLGMSFRLAACAALDVAYCYVSSADPERTGSYPVYDYTSGDLASVFTRNYKLHAHVLSFGMRFNF